MTLTPASVSARRRKGSSMKCRVCVIAALFSSALLATPIAGQSATKTTTAGVPPPTSSPIPIGPSAYLRITSAASDNFVYYHGGQLNADTFMYSGELFSLDLTKSWSKSYPAWTNLTLSTGTVKNPVAWGHSATMSSDQSKLYLTAPTNNQSDPFFYEYDIKTATWATISAPAAQAAAWSNRREAQLLTDPETGAIWYLGGSFNDNTETNEIDKFLNGAWSVNLATTEPDANRVDGPIPSVFNKFSAGTSHIYNNKIYLFGGFITTASGAPAYQSFQSLPVIDIAASPLIVRRQLTIGAVPPARHDHCSVLTASKKVIVFGGYDINTKTTFDDMWSLDLVTLTWQQIVPNNPTKPRYGHTCNIAGANMIVFGGQASAGSAGPVSVGFKDLQVYDVMTSTWMASYNPKKDTTPISQAMPGSSGPSSSKAKLSAGAIAGIVIGVVAFVAIISGIVYYRHRQRKLRAREAEMEKAAYLKSLGSPEERSQRKHSSQRRRRNNPYAASSPHSDSTRRFNNNGPGQGGGTSSISSPTMGYGSDLDTGVAAPGSFTGGGGGGGSNVQYLMQQLPDGTIAVQPVYLDHQPIQHLQHSPNMMYSENSSLGGFVNASLSPKKGTTQIQATDGTGVGEGNGTGTSPRPGHFVPPPAPPLAPNSAQGNTATNRFTAEASPYGELTSFSRGDGQPGSARVVQDPLTTSAIVVEEGDMDPFSSPVSARAVPHPSSPRQTRRH
ncbi:hypothetical protein BG004_002197 [Podila humilis]|nr:hypothetical protein BG004_002197 [Podila humilis]